MWPCVSIAKEKCVLSNVVNDNAGLWLWQTPSTIRHGACLVHKGSYFLHTRWDSSYMGID